MPWTDLAVQCAPDVSPVTIEAIIRVESHGNPLAMHVNGLKVQPVLPATASEVAKVAAAWIARGFSVDLGPMQVNSRNLPRLGLGIEQVLDPCTNIRAGATILAADYAQAVKAHGGGQEALQAALSAYNTGDFARGFANGYVARYYGPVPALAPTRMASRPGPRQNPYTADPTVRWTENNDG